MQIHEVSPQEMPSESSDSEQEHLYTCRESSTSKVATAKVRINNVEIKMIIDTGRGRSRIFRMLVKNFVHEYLGGISYYTDTNFLFGK